MQSTFHGWIFVFCLSLSAVAQQSTPPAQGEMPPSSPAGTDRQITLDVVVTDATGKVVPGLQQSDFTILDNKKPTKILSFQAQTAQPQPAATLTPPAPLETILVIDEVNTSFERVAYERAEIKHFLQQNGGKLAQSVSLVFFADDGTQIESSPSSDAAALIADFDKHEVALRSIRRSTGIYGADERLQLSLKTLDELAAHEATRPGRKLVIWISPGWPILSGPRIYLTLKQEQGIFGSIVNVSAALRNARITLYSVDPLGLADSAGLRTTYYEEFLKGVTKPNDSQIGNLALQVLATQSGGLAIHGNNSIVDGINRCIADASAFYVLSMQAAPADRPNEYHGLEVKLANPRLTARTRTGYYAQP